jgi:hypothetical protein
MLELGPRFDRLPRIKVFSSGVRVRDGLAAAATGVGFGGSVDGWRTNGSKSGTGVGVGSAMANSSGAAVGKGVGAGGGVEPGVALGRGAWEFGRGSGGAVSGAVAAVAAAWAELSAATNCRVLNKNLGGIARPFCEGRLSVPAGASSLRAALSRSDSASASLGACDSSWSSVTSIILRRGRRVGATANSGGFSGGCTISIRIGASGRLSGSFGSKAAKRRRAKAWIRTDPRKAKTTFFCFTHMATKITLDHSKTPRFFLRACTNQGCSATRVNSVAALL